MVRWTVKRIAAPFGIFASGHVGTLDVSSWDNGDRRTDGHGSLYVKDTRFRPSTRRCATELTRRRFDRRSLDPVGSPATKLPQRLVVRCLAGALGRMVEGREIRGRATLIPAIIISASSHRPSIDRRFRLLSTRVTGRWQLRIQSFPRSRGPMRRRSSKSPMPTSPSPRVEQGLDAILRLTSESADFSRFLRSPVINTEQKAAAIDAVLAKSGADATVANFVKVGGAQRAPVRPAGDHQRVQGRALPRRAARFRPTSPRPRRSPRRRSFRSARRSRPRSASPSRSTNMSIPA